MSPAAMPSQLEFPKTAHSSPAADDSAQGPKHQDPKREGKPSRLSLQESMERIQDARKQCPPSTSTMKRPASNASSKPVSLVQAPGTMFRYSCLIVTLSYSMHEPLILSPDKPHVFALVQRRLVAFLQF